MRIALTRLIWLRANVRGSSTIHWIVVSTALVGIGASVSGKVRPWLEDAAEQVGLRLSAGTAGDTDSDVDAREPARRAALRGLRPTPSANVVPAGLRVIEPPDFPEVPDSALPFGLSTEDWYTHMTTLTTGEELDRFAKGAIDALRDQVEQDSRELDEAFDQWKEMFWDEVAGRRRALAERFSEDSPQFRQLDEQLAARAELEFAKGADRYGKHRQTLATYAEQVRLAIDQARLTRFFELTQEVPASGAIAQTHRR